MSTRNPSAPPDPRPRLPCPCPVSCWIPSVAPNVPLSPPWDPQPIVRMLFLKSSLTRSPPAHRPAVAPTALRRTSAPSAWLWPRSGPWQAPQPLCHPNLVTLEPHPTPPGLHRLLSETAWIYLTQPPSKPRSSPPLPGSLPCLLRPTQVSPCELALPRHRDALSELYLWEGEGWEEGVLSGSWSRSWAEGLTLAGERMRGVVRLGRKLPGGRNAGREQGTGRAWAERARHWLGLGIG